MLLAIGLFTVPTSARAGCNHLVGSRSDKLANLNQLDELILFGTSSSARHMGGETPEWPGPDRPTPCSGLSCSNRFPLPVSTMTPGPEGRDRWGSLPVVLVVDDSSVFTRRAEGPSLAPVGDMTSIFHPPRV
jgi:hypothetical protein